MPGGPGGPTGPGVLLRYPEGIWLSSASILLIWSTSTQVNQTDLKKLCILRTMKFSDGKVIIGLTVHKLFTNLSGNGAHHVLGCKVSLEIKDRFMRTKMSFSLIICGKFHENNIHTLSPFSPLRPIGPFVQEKIILEESLDSVLAFKLKGIMCCAS